MICGHCSRETPHDSGFCAACGKPIDLQTTHAAGGVFVPDPEATSDQLTAAPGIDTAAHADARLPATEDSDGEATRLGDSAHPRKGGSGAPLVPGTTLSPRYHIIRLLGVGGMGAVYQAWDATLGVAVALKVIRPESNTEEAILRLERRFKQELLLARQVTHKNVVRIHDLGEIEGIKYITMPYIEGADLASVLRKSGAMTVSECVRIARDVVAGLRAAHDAGVVHRDLKPANIMIDGDHAVIMDFGIARSTSPAGAAKAAGSPGTSVEGTGGFMKPHAPAGATAAGAVVGTLEYMAPEQARGETVDHRADIYAFGLIVRDMLLGGRQHTAGESAFEDLTRRMEQAPPSARSVDPRIPQPLDDIVAKCVRPAAADRYQTTAELAAALDRLDAAGNLLPKPRRFTRWQLAAASALLAVIVSGTWWAAHTPAPAAPHSLVSVLISDFDNRSGDPVFEGAVEQTLKLALETAPYITVFSTTDARAIAAQISPGKSNRITEDVGQLIARREGVKVMLAGTIDKRGTGYRLELRATDPATGKAIATAARNVSEKAEVLRTAAAMVVSVRAALGESKTEMGKLADAETVTAGSLDAMSAYARGQALQIAGKFTEALPQYQRAVELDPRFGRAYAGIAGVYANYFKQRDKAEANFQLALKHLDRMTEREKYRTLGKYYLDVAGNYEKAVETYGQLVRLYPADDSGHGGLALAYVLSGDLPRALPEVQATLDIYPHNSLQRYNYAMYSMYAGNFQSAIAEAERVQKENPTLEYAWLPIAVSRLAQGDIAGSREAYARLAAMSTFGASFAQLGLADTEMYLGRHRAAIRLLRDGLAADATRKDSHAMAQKYVALAEAYWAVGDRRQAAEASSEAVKLTGRESVLYPAARVLLQAGEYDKAAQIADDLEKKLQRHTTAYARLIQGEIALERGRLSDAIDAISDAQKRRDSWFSRYLLGRAYLAAGGSHAAEALAELERCLKRRGEASDAFIDDMPTLRYLPPAYYWLARAQEAVGSAVEAGKNYEEFLSLRRDSDASDPLAADARRRVSH